jgi:DNA-binding cell septation regulator SpoVG
MGIKVLEIRTLHSNAKSLRAFVDVQIGDLILKDFRILEENGGKSYVKAPFTTYKDKTGQLRFRQIIDLPAEVRGRIDNMILSEYYREKEKQHGTTD